MDRLPAKSTFSISELARSHAPAAIDTLVDLMKNGSEKTKLMAAMVLLDRGCGRVPAAGTDVFDAPVKNWGPLPTQEPAPQQARIAPAEQATISKEVMRDARIRVLEAINQNPGVVFTGPVAADHTSLPSNITSAVLVQLHRDGHIERGGPGMFKAKAN